MKITIRLNISVIDAWVSYASTTGLSQIEVIALAVEFLSRNLEAKKKGDPYWKYKVTNDLRRDRFPRLKNRVVGTAISPKTEEELKTLKEISGASFGKLINEALMQYIIEMENAWRPISDDAVFSRLIAPIPALGRNYDLFWLDDMPSGVVVYKDEGIIPDYAEHKTVLVDSSFLLAMMTRAEDWFFDDRRTKRDSHEIREKKSLFTTTAHLTDFSVKAALLLEAHDPSHLRDLLGKGAAPNWRVLGASALVERMIGLFSSGVNIIQIEAKDFVPALKRVQNLLPQPNSKLLSIAAAMRVSGSADVICFGFRRTSRIPLMPVWERYRDGYCVTISSRHKDYSPYTKYDETPPEGADLALNVKENPYFPYLHRIQH